MEIAQPENCESRLKLAEARLNTMSAQTDSWLWETDENHVFTYFTNNVSQLTGLQVSDLLGTSRLDVALGSDDPNWQGHARDLRKHRAFKDFRYIRKSSTGEDRHIIVTGWPGFDEEGNFTGYRGTAWDETLQIKSSARQVEKEENLLAEIESQRANLETVLENLSQSVMWFDKYGVIRMNNAQTPKLLGFTSQEYGRVYNLKQHLTLMAERGDFGDVDVASEVDKRAERLCAEQQDTLSYRIHLQSSDRYLDIGLRSLADGSHILTHTDVTTEARKDREIRERQVQLEKMQHDLAQANEQLEDRVEERTRQLRRTQDLLVKNERQALLGDLVSSLCHELRNPLNALNTSLFLIRRNVEDDFPKLTRAFDRSERTIKRCTNILTDLFDYALVDALKKEPVAIAPWLCEVIENAQIPQVFNVSLDVENQLPVCEIDGDQLGSAVGKIITNAAQAVADNLNPTADPAIQIYAGDCGDQIEIIISDNGPGMDEETFAMAMQPLFSTRGFGVGLGLPIAEQIIKRHGGEIKLETLHGAGTTVTIWLPVSDRKMLKAA